MRERGVQGELFLKNGAGGYFAQMMFSYGPTCLSGGSFNNK